MVILVRVGGFADDGVHRFAKRGDGVADGPQLFNWDSRTGELTREWLLPRMNATRFSLTHDGRYLAIGTLEGKIALYRVAEKRS